MIVQSTLLQKKNKHTNRRLSVNKILLISAVSVLDRKKGHLAMVMGLSPQRPCWLTWDQFQMAETNGDGP